MMELPLNTLKRIRGWVKALHLPPLSGPLPQAAHIRLLTPSYSPQVPYLLLPSYLSLILTTAIR